MSTAENLVRDNRSWLRYAARAGYGARGLVLVIIGYFAMRAAYATGRAVGTKDAVDAIAGSAFGTIVLIALVVSLFFFAVWRLLQVLFDIDDHGLGPKGLFVRAGLTISMFAYGTLALYAFGLVTGIAGGSGGGGGLISKAYAAGYGVWVTYGVVAGMVAAGIAHLVKGIKAGFRKYMNIPSEHATWLSPVCRFGLIARGVTFFILAGLLFDGAVSYSDGDKPGLDTALSAMSGWSFGWLLLAITGVGLIAFGIYGFAEAAYRRIEIEAVA